MRQLELLVALWRFGRLHPAELQELAWAAQAEGHDGPALSRLAAEEWSTWGEVGALVERALGEMGQRIPTREEAGMAVARHVAAKIVSGDVPPEAGARDIWWNIWNEIGRPPALTAFADNASEYEDERSRGETEWAAHHLKEIVAEARKLLASTGTPAQLEA